ncbi:mannose-1-phosphate guanylyltransferase/mannose-6-phosphate isomerase [Aliagarivorans marinus]|uniref:mannose-1-phosphate guanylyltransferase/mannose-6-phosphate isomerase n=1 Tax=Aliagarivorans marinus TaxID=561965 RepID=UPI000478A974|nr:mannose-1-phosphate guanylyltransferase/mannose-6-phosphate isomerase [Aliagarivorans marinus]
MLLPVIMAGGSGTRLWPLSRVLYPKQLIPLVGEQSMLQATVQRLFGLSTKPPLVVSNEDYRFITAEQLRAINQLDKIILEPEGRNTAPAIALAALEAQCLYPDDDPLLLILAADHVIRDEQAFQQSVRKAIPFAEQGKLVTFGIVPDQPETGYGYINAGQPVFVDKGADKPNDAFEVKEFVEKPDKETAEAYLKSGKYYWNSGMFLFRASVYLNELKRFREDIHQACVASMAETTPDMDFVRVDSEAFAACPAESIDYAVMEPLSAAGDDVVVVPMDAQWNDVGSWSALWDVTDKDDDGNSFKGDVLSHESHNCYVSAENKLVATVGVNDLVVVETKDAVLVANKGEVQKVKKIVEQLKEAGRGEHLNHREVYRPWGKYDSIDAGHRYQVKRITVKPGEKLSVQMHHHRAEHWIVVKGTAMVTNGDETFLVSENQSTYIPIGVTHALENPGKVPLELIEVQSGSYLGEDDIVRFEDRYGRLK